MESEKWLSLYRRLWIRDDPIYERKQEEIITIDLLSIRHLFQEQTDRTILYR